jgi:DNA-directed RNA polymerase specialized sigma subunit
MVTEEVEVNEVEIPEKKKRVFRQKDSPHYVDNKLFAAELTAWIVSNKDNGKRLYWNEMPRYVAECLMKIVDHFALQSCWRGYSYLDEMKSEAIINLVKGIHNYNINFSPNAFAYASEITRKSFIYVLDNEKKQATLRNETVSRNSIYNYNNISLDDPDHE